MPKPVRKKKHFIRKKESTTYRLIPGYVEDDEDVPGAKPNDEELEKRKEEQREFGIFYDDEYNYMKHLRSVKEEATMVNTAPDTQDEMRSQMTMPPLPFREFFSTDETEEEKIDPEILAALDEAPVVALDDIEEENESQMDFLDDDFIVKAGGIVPVEKKPEVEDEYVDDREFDFDDEDIDDDEYETASEDNDSNLSDRVSNLSFGEEETEKSRTRGTAEDDIIEAQTALILKNFEEGLGFRCSTQDTIEEEEMPTEADYEHLKHIMKHDMLKEKRTPWSEVFDDKSDRPKIDTQRYLYEDEDEYEWKEVPPAKPKYDCVSILSLNSNTRNRPTDIIIPSKPKPKKQSESESTTSAVQQGLTLRQLEEEMRESRRADKASTYRPDDETKEEKRARKKAVKEERKERRQEKKANKMVFSIENEKMKKESATLSKAGKGVKLS